MDCMFDCGATLSASLTLFGLAAIAAAIAYRWPWSTPFVTGYIMIAPASYLLHGFPNDFDRFIAWSGIAIPILGGVLGVVRRVLARRSRGPA